MVVERKTRMLRPRLDDSIAGADVQVGEILARLEADALSDNPHLRLHALQRIQDFGKKAAPFHVTLEKATTGGTYDSRCCAEVTLHLLDQRPISYPDPR
jgi:hypothetical protein